MRLAEKERSILRGTEGVLQQKIMDTIVRYGEALNAEELVDIEGNGHFSISSPAPGTSLPMEMLDELADAGLKTKYPFTLDPYAPLDFENLALTSEQERLFREMFHEVPRYHSGMLELGLTGRQGYTCSCYLPEVGNIPKRDCVVAWSESSCVIYANSVLGARTHRNAAILDILSNIAGKTPLCGLLTEEGRKASWLVELKTSSLPHPQLLGGAIGKKVQEDIPFITGIDSFLGTEINEPAVNYLKEMGAACAALGAVGLYHADNLTPEAKEKGRDILKSDNKRYVIDDSEMEMLLRSYPVMWEDPGAKPQKCIIGCPHLSIRQLHLWAEKIRGRLSAAGRKEAAIPTILCSSLQGIEEFRNSGEPFDRIQSAGVLLSAMCAEDYMRNELCAQEAVVTNSNKLRAFTTARFFPDDHLLEIIAEGEMPS